MSAQSNLHGRSEIILSQFSSAEREALLRDNSSLNALSALSAYSPALIQALAARLDLARWLFLERAYEKAAHLPNLRFELSAQLRNVDDLAGLQSALRTFKLKEFSRLAARDLTNRADLREVIETLSSIADACIIETLEKALIFTADRFGLTPKTLGLRPVIMGMGKLGARELNYSSDVDLIYLYHPDKFLDSAPSAVDVSDVLFTTVTRAISEVTEGGLVFRVDLNLRPGGKDGAQAQSLDAARKHYLALGKPWERMALLKARPVAGDIEKGHEFLNDIAPFIYRRHLDYTSLEEIKDLKIRLNRSRKARMNRGLRPGKSEPDIDVKLSPGGIREIEFFAQALTLTFGGRLPHLRQITTMRALSALAEEKIISREDAEQLTKAYIHLRTVEHRLQLREMTQTQTVPRNQTSRDSLAMSMGFFIDPWTGFKGALDENMREVARRYDALLSDADEEAEIVETSQELGSPGWGVKFLESLYDTEASLAILKEAGFKRPDAALAACRNIRQERFLPDSLARYGANLERLLPAMIAGAASSFDPDRAVLHLERFLGSIGPKAGFFVLLEENTSLIKLLSILFGSSDYLSDILINHPALLDSLIDRRSAVLVKNKALMASELDVMLGQDDDPESCLTVIRRFKNDETLRIGLYDLLDKLSLNRINSQLTDLAEVVMDRTMALAAEMVLPGKDIRNSPLSVAVMGMGKLGGRELTYGSDLDLIFILGQGKNLTNIGMEEAIKLSQRFISFISLYMEAGPGYEIDSRLRPSGGSGPLVVTLESFENYHQSSQLWERQALIKMRRALGPPQLCSKIKTLANKVIFNSQIPEDAAARINSLRDKMTRERARLRPGFINPKFSAGGMVDAEFMTQYLQMLHGKDKKGGVRSTSTAAALRALAASRLGPPGLAAAAPAYEYVCRTASRLGLLYARHGDRAAYNEEEISQLRLKPGDPDPYETLKSSMEVIRNLYVEVFGE